MQSSSQDAQHKSFRINHDDDKFFSRLLSKETSNSNPSFRVYYGDVYSAVPFVWETTPGTPKHAFSDNSVPPLTPPPSYNYNKNVNKSLNKHSRSKILYNLLKSMSFKKVVHVGSSPSSSSASHSGLSSLSFSTSSSLSSFSDTKTPSCSHRRRRFSSWGSSFDHDHDHHHEELGRSSRFCFGIRRNTGGRNVKKGLLSIVGRGSG